MKYWLIELSHNCSFKGKGNFDMVGAVHRYIASQNKGEAKSDRLIIKKIKKLTEDQFNKHPYSDQTYNVKEFIIKPHEPTTHNHSGV